MRFPRLLAVALAMGSLTPCALGVSIAESFDYAPGALDGAAGGIGWAGPWAVSLPAGVTGDIAVSSGSIAFSDFPTSGNKAALNVTATTAFLTAAAQRPIAQAQVAGDVWVSFLYQRTDGLTSTTSRTAEVRLNDGAINFGAQIKPSSSTGAAVRYDGATGGNFTAPGTNLHDNGDPYLVIARYPTLGTAGASASMWVLSPDGYDTIKPAGILESELDTVALIKATDVTTQAEDLAIGELVQLVNATSAAPFSFSVDELRIDESLQAVVPEPAAAGIAAALGLGLLARGRRSAPSR